MGNQFNFPNYPNEQNILFGVPLVDNESLVLNFCILYGKFYIYKQRLFGGNIVSLDTFLVSLKSQLEIEEKICTLNNRSDHFDKFLDIFRLLQIRFQIH